MKLIKTYNPINWSDIELIEIKYKKYSERLVNTLDMRLQCIIRDMHEYNTLHNNIEYDHCLLDVKVRNLDKDQCGCAIEGFHYDWVRTYNEKPDVHETHYIYTNVNGTEYVDGKCDDNSIYMYNRELHRGPLMQDITLRVLIRLSYVNKR